MGAAELILQILRSNSNHDRLQLLQSSKLAEPLKSHLNNAIYTHSNLKTLLKAAFGEHYTEKRLRTLPNRAKELVRLGEDFDTTLEPNSAAFCYALAISCATTTRQTADFYLALEKLQHWANNHSVDSPALVQIRNEINRTETNSKRAIPTWLPTLHDANALKQRINRGDIMVKCVSQSLTHLDFLLHQLRDPIHNRPRPDHHRNRSKRYFARLNRHETRHVLPRASRGLSNSHYSERQPQRDAYAAVPIKKTAMSLAAPDGIMGLFNRNYTVGFLFDLNRCNTKQERYIFTCNMRTRDCGWLGHSPQSHYRNTTNTATLAELHSKQQQNRRNGSEWSNHTEQLIAPTKQALAAITATFDDSHGRLCAAMVADYVEARLGLRLPMFVMTGYSVIRDYSDAEFREDVDRQPDFALKQACYYFSKKGMNHALRALDRISAATVLDSLAIALNRRNHYAVEKLLAQPRLPCTLNTYINNTHETFLEAIVKYYPQHLKRFLDLGANPNYEGPSTPRNALDAAIKLRRFSVVKILLDHGARPRNQTITKACIDALQSQQILHFKALMPYALKEANSAAQLFTAIGDRSARLDATTCGQLYASFNCLPLQTLQRHPDLAVPTINHLTAHSIRPSAALTYLASRQPEDNLLRRCKSAGCDLTAAAELALQQSDDPALLRLLDSGATPQLNQSYVLFLERNQQLNRITAQLQTPSSACINLFYTAYLRIDPHLFTALYALLDDDHRSWVSKRIVTSVLTGKSDHVKTICINKLISLGCYNGHESTLGWLSELASTKSHQFMFKLLQQPNITAVDRNVVLQAMLADAMFNNKHEVIDDFILQQPHAIDAAQLPIILSKSTLASDVVALQSLFKHSQIDLLSQLHNAVNAHAHHSPTLALYPALMDFAKTHGLAKAFDLARDGSQCLIHMARYLKLHDCAQSTKHQFAQLCQRWINQLPGTALASLTPLINKHSTANVLCKRYGLWRLKTATSLRDVKQTLEQRARSLQVTI